MIRTVLADDEVLAWQKLRQVLKEIVDVEVVGECASARETIELAKLTNPDLLFLDIHMPDMNGFDVMDALSSIPDASRPHVAFVTANDRCAVRAFDIHAIDYILKPYTVERLRTTLDRVREQQALRANGNSETLLLQSTSGSRGQTQKATERYATRLVFKSRGRILFLPISEIRWIEADENYVRICTGTASHLLRETIGHMERQLDPHSFLRVHRSAIVNLHFVKEVKHEPDGDATVILTGGEKIAMSRTCRTRIQKLLER